VHYRPYKPADLAQIHALEELCFPPSLRFSREYIRQLVSRVKAATWVAEEDGKLTGFASAGWKTRRSGTVAYLETIEVSPGSRGKGIGRELLRLIEGSAAEARAASIWLHVDTENLDAIRLYESQGYHHEGNMQEFYADGHPAFVFNKQL
jgi:ribosomal protein S18 acetylase RimI-like enzyme